MNKSTQVRTINEVNRKLKEKGIDKEIFDIHDFQYFSESYKGTFSYNYIYTEGNGKVIYTNHIIVKRSETYVDAILEQLT